MRSNNNLRRLLILIAMLGLMLLLFSGCRHRITDDTEADTTIEDYDGYIQELYDERQDELELEGSRKSWFAGLHHETEEPDEEPEYDEDFDYDEDYYDEDDDYYDEEYDEDDEDEDEDDDDGSSPSSPASRRPSVTPARPVPVTPSTPAVAVTVNVKFDANGGKVDKDSMSVTYNSRYGALPFPSREGYTFKGWFTDKDLGMQVTAETTVSNKSEHTLYAHWEKTTPQEPKQPEKQEEKDTEYKITLDVNGGEGKLDTLTMKSGDKYKDLPEPEREGYEFRGWYTKAEGGKKVSDGDTFKGSKDKTLYAHWKEIKEQEEEPDYKKEWSSEFSKAAEGVKDEDRVTCYIVDEDDDRSDLVKDCRGDIVGEPSEDEDAPQYVIRFTDDMDKAEELADETAENYPNSKILIVPEESYKSEDDNQKLFYKLLLFYSIYGGEDTEEYLKTASEQLAAEGSIYMRSIQMN